VAIDFEQVKTSLYDWAVANLPANTPVIFLYQNAPRPDSAYVTLYLSSVVQIGDDFIPQPTTAPGDIEQQGDREFTLQIATYGGDCFTRLENLRSSLQKETVLATLRESGIAFVQHFPIQDVTELVSSRFENRAQMDVLFRIGQTYSEVSGSIETVEIDEEFSNGDSVVYSDTQTITAAP
jgi:hypothetical protein